MSGKRQKKKEDSALERRAGHFERKERGAGRKFSRFSRGKNQSRCWRVGCRLSAVRRLRCQINAKEHKAQAKSLHPCVDIMFLPTHLP